MVNQEVKIVLVLALFLFLGMSLFQISENNFNNTITGRAVSDFDGNLEFHFDFENNYIDSVSGQTYLESINGAGSYASVMNTSERALRLNNGYLRQVSTLPKLFNITAAEDFSFSLWIKRQRTGVEGVFYTANLSKNTNTAHSPSMWFTSSDTPRFRANQGLIDIGAPVQILPEEGWTHIAFTADRAGLARWYKNGVEVGSGEIFSSQFSPLNTDLGNLLLGTIKTESSYLNISGDLDDFRYYNRMLSSSEVEELYAENVSIYKGCVLNEIYWEDTSVEHEESASFIVRGAGCYDTNVQVEVRIKNPDYEDELVDVETITLNALYANVSENWIAEYDFRINESATYYDTDYYLFALLTEDFSVNVSSLSSNSILGVRYIEPAVNNTQSSNNSSSNTNTNNASNTNNNKLDTPINDEDPFENIENNTGSGTQIGSSIGSSSSSGRTNSGSNSNSVEDDQINQVLRYTLIAVLSFLIIGIISALVFILKKKDGRNLQRYVR